MSLCQWVSPKSNQKFLLAKPAPPQPFSYEMESYLINIDTFLNHPLVQPHLAFMQAQTCWCLCSAASSIRTVSLVECTFNWSWSNFANLAKSCDHWLVWKLHLHLSIYVSNISPKPLLVQISIDWRFIDPAVWSSQAFKKTTLMDPYHQYPNLRHRFKHAKDLFINMQCPNSINTEFEGTCPYHLLSRLV